MRRCRTAGTLLLGLLAVGCQSRHLPHGPLAAPNPHEWVVDAAKGKVFTDGLEILYLRGTRPAVIRSVSVTGGGPALHFLGASLALPGRRFGFNEEMPGYPPRAIRPTLVVPAVGHRILPAAQTLHRASYQLLLGYQVRAARFAVRTSVTIRYTVDGRLYETVMPARLVSCPSGHQVACLRQAPLPDG